MCAEQQQLLSSPETLLDQSLRDAFTFLPLSGPDGQSLSYMVALSIDGLPDDQGISSPWFEMNM